MKIDLAGDKLIISFAYDQEIVNKVKTLPGRKYNALIKSWEVPALFIKEVLYGLKSLNPVFSPEVEELAKERPKQGIKSDLPLYGFQKQGVEFLMNNRRCLLGSEQGLGKTLQAVMACEELGSEKNLIVSMASLKFNLKEEILKWYPKAKVVVIHGRLSERMQQYRQDAKYYITSYELCRQDIEILKNF